MFWSRNIGSMLPPVMCSMQFNLQIVMPLTDTITVMDGICNLTDGFPSVRHYLHDKVLSVKFEFYLIKFTILTSKIASYGCTFKGSTVHEVDAVSNMYESLKIFRLEVHVCFLNRRKE